MSYGKLRERSWIDWRETGSESQVEGARWRKGAVVGLYVLIGK